MPDSGATPLRWNIFARELESILAAHGWTLGHLDDRDVVYNREKVRRLQKSLVSPGHLATLNPDEMQRLIDVLELNDLEQKRLQASLLATAVERTLLDRVDKDVAFNASQDVFTILLEAMAADPTTISGVKGGSTFIDDGDVVDDTVAGRILYLLDRALLAIHIAREALTLQARLLNAQEAVDIATRVLNLLREAGDKDEDWQHWQKEAVSVQQMAAAILQTIQPEEETL